MGIPSLPHGDVERVTGVLEWTQREVCPAFQNLCLTLCLCQPTTNNNPKKKKKSHHQTVDSQLPWPKNNNNSPYIRPFKNSHAQHTSQTPSLHLTWASGPPSVTGGEDTLVDLTKVRSLVINVSRPLRLWPGSLILKCFFLCWTWHLWLLSVGSLSRDTWTSAELNLRPDDGMTA